MITWDNDLINAIARRRSVIVIGSGVSKNSTNAAGKRPASWEEFLKEASNSLGNPPVVDDLIANRDFLTACEIIKRRLSTDVFVSRVQAEYQQPGYRPAEIHEHIYNLDSSIVASPNFDVIYDTYATGVSNGSVVVKDHTSTDIIRYLSGGETRLVLKTHGTANTPIHLIFTRKDYAEARTKYVLFYEILKSLILTHTFLFLGCGVDDPDIRLLFEDVQFAHGRMPLHYMTIPQNEVDDEVLSVATDSMRIKFHRYSRENGHLELTDSLKDLVQRVDSARVQLGTDQKW
ncbi:SIR2 family protein [Burkholderia gladioli]|uniref:SIR2 family protein n=1 Tax=Burkholderia gladioli TaxID=28095 RepID=UPI001640087E|nr:SIR2 family protein [Burkholderia gladioli]